MSEESKLSDIVLLDELDDLLKRTSPKMASESEITQIDITCDSEINLIESQPADKDLMILDEVDDCGLESEDEAEFRKRDMSFINPEDVERAILNMPTSKQITDEMAHLKQTRKVTVSPLSILDMNDSHVIELVSSDSIQEFNTAFVKDGKNPQSFVGILKMTFSTSKSAEKAVSHLKNWNDSLDVKIDPRSHQSMESFVHTNAAKNKWTDNVAVLKNLSSEVTEDAIRDLFPSVDDVVLHLDSSKSKKPHRSSPAPKSDAATNENTENVSTTEQPKDSSVIVISSNTSDANDAGYTPTKSVSSNAVSALPSAPPKGYAYLVFSSEDHMKSEVQSSVEKRLELCGYKLILLAYKAPVHAIPRTYLRLRERKAVLSYIEKCTNKLENLKNSGDAKATQSLEEKLNKSKTVLENDNQSRKDMGLNQPSLEQLACMNGLPKLDQALIQKTLSRYGILKDKKEPEDISSSKKQSNDKNKKRFRGGNRRGYSPRRRSPYKRNKPYSNFTPRNRGSSRDNQSSLLGNAALANPLAQIVMQQNLLGAGLGGIGGLADGLLSNPYKKENQMLRLDNTGNFRFDSETCYPALSSYNNNDRSNEPRRRSRSPVGKYPRRDSDDGRAVAGINSLGGDDSVNLLLNLSQMLSNKIDSRRQQIEPDRGANYNRRYGDY